MDENYLTSILDCTEQCCKLLLCTLCNTLPREIVTINGQESIVCLSCAEKQYSNGKILHLSLINSNIKYNKVLALLNRTFRTLFELSESSNESKEHIEPKKQAIKEGVLTCLNLLRPTIRENNQITPIIEQKKKIIIKKKNFNILRDESDDNDENDNENENDKENQSTTPVLDDNLSRRKTVRGSNSSKRSNSLKQQENESPSKRTKKTEDPDEPLNIISPTVVKKTTSNQRKTSSDEGKDKKVKSLRLARKVHITDDSKSMETSKLTRKDEEEQTTKMNEETVVQEKPTINRKKPTMPAMDIRNDKGESLVHQAVKKGDITRVKQLIEEGHSVNTIDHNSWTPLHEACAMKNIPLMELLLAHNANINVQGGNERMTVLHEAVSSDDADENIIKFLLEHGADPYIENKYGKTAIDLVTESTKRKLSSPIEKIQCINPASTDLPIAPPPPRRRGRTTSSTNILFFTGFDKAKKESLIKSIQTIFGRKCVSTAKFVENNVTHVITCGEEDRIAFRTINYLRGVVLGKWIVSEKWIDECIKQKQWINENQYEILGSQIEPNSNGSHTSRIKHEQNETLLFDKYQFYLYGQFHTYKKEDLADLIKITNGTLLKREPKLHRIDSDTDINNSHSITMTYIIYESTVPDVLLDNNRIKHIKLLDFLSCIDSYDTHGRLDN